MSRAKILVEASATRARRRPGTARGTSPATEPAAKPAAPPSSDLRVLVTSHSHPKLTKGGAEISAYALFRGLQSRKDTTTWFLGGSSGRTQSRVGSCISQPFGDSEFVYDPVADFDYFKFANPDPEFPRALDELIKRLAPDIIHAHHYAIFGVEAFRRIKRIRPGVKIFLTLHEYLAICHNHGQMVKAQTLRLCQRETFLDCRTCFPYISSQDFFLRKQYFLHFLAYVDRFIAPSQFLANRYIAWGLPDAKVTVLENIMPWHQKTVPAGRVDVVSFPNSSKRPRLRVGFFGQMSALKGIKVLLQAAKLMHDRRVRGVSFDVFGDYSNQPQEFQQEVINAFGDAQLTSNLVYHGPYENEDVNRLMQLVDVVVMPSVWWENSPVVIREALQNRRPVVCSNIGGMAEKVRPGLDGLHFNVGDAASLATVLEDLLNNPEALDQIRATVNIPCAAEESLEQHVQLYKSTLLSGVDVR